MKKIIKIVLLAIGILVLMLVVLLGYFRLTEWVPAKEEIVYENTLPIPVSMPDTLTILSWNIGYAGLGDDMDFFYDGGKSVRTSEERTMQNMDSIIAFLTRNKADFILIQEVDRDAKRSYRTDQFEQLSREFPNYTAVYADNYVSQFVPIPFDEPIGKVRSGLATFSKYPVSKAVRYQYPSAFPFPVRLFNLKRAMLSINLTLPGDRILYINNTHNTAFDTGNMRAQELAFMSDFMLDKPLSVTAGDWNSNPPGYIAGERELTNPDFSPIAVKQTDFPDKFTFVSDFSIPTMRYGYEPYIKGSTITSTLDFALCGPDIEVISTEVFDLGFRNSDHNPIIFRVKIK